ncbi:hypothetical protein Gbro_1440 [Gordonia bronchialis DSM 43247]|uniref:Uncharacterized protein n=1 Tax=Gordonia bronchialis (strain ATCC 25592 / DSM 43247 / BCRC 13721 / JCM 3198 / KCTC 3076 / NBRC 16047 / NCTC 10667) TaxID=526226 RepID=D0L6G5_GORB4|nr:hypothetical protein [Gordonia bronchialis]ACY20722.1 hypothetical protein Gbro_1440 [Gordonia bronchialis DSM 43247]MCC3323495.1 hypothetical protein [Gordonia bronchialis]QGS25528.1 hypothetical protein FOB84_16675 [Gordonia bronchialis]STQ63551.1 Uncharacterised protein [Gordonia bronchialis]
MTGLLVGLVLVAAILAVLFLAGFVLSVCDESDRQLEVARINRERRLAEARINRLTTSAIQQMTDIAQRRQAGPR